MRKYFSKLEKILHWLVAVLLVATPLYMKFPLVFVKGTFVTVRLEDVLIMLILLVWLAVIISSGEWRKIVKDRLNQAMLVFFLIGGVSVVSAVFLTHSATLRLSLLHLLRRVEVMALLPVGAWVVKEKKQVGFYLLALSIVLVLVNLYALGQKYLGLPAVSTTNSELSKGLIFYLGKFDRVNSTFSGHYDLATFLIMSLSVLAAIIFCLKKPLLIVGLGFLSALSFLVLVMTAARLSFIAAIAGIFASLILLKRKKEIVIALLLFTAALAYPTQLRERFISTFTVNIQKSWSKYFAVSEEQEKRSQLNIPTLPATGSKIETIGAEAADIAPGEPVDTTDLGVYRSFEIRTKVEWPRAGRAFIKNPLLGTGYSSLGLATDSDLLRSLGEVGILGTLAFVLVLTEVIKRVWAVFEKSFGLMKYFSAGILAMILAFLVNSLFIDVFEASKVATMFWLIIGITLGAGSLRTEYNEKN